MRIHSNGRFRARTGRWLLALLLFAQFALAVQACTLPGASPSTAYAPSASCHDLERGSANACLAHCLQGDQTLDSSHGVAPAAPASAGFPLPPAVFIPFSVSFQEPIGGTDPPLSIRFCSLQL
jgi:hypothetical protein